MLVRRADGDADRVWRAESRQRADDHALAEQRVEQCPRAVSTLDVDEVTHRAGNHVVPGVAQEPLELGAAFAVQVASPGKLGGRVEARERRLLPGRRDVERAARLAELRDEI